MKYNGQTFFEDIEDSYKETSSAFDETVLAEIFKEDDDNNIRDQFKELAEKISSETAGMSEAEAYKYYEENVAEGWWDVVKGGVGWVADKVLGGGGGGGGSTSTSTATNSGTNTGQVNPTINPNINPNFSPVINISPSLTQAPVQSQSSSQRPTTVQQAAQQLRQQITSQMNPQMNPQFNPYFNPNMVPPQAPAWPYPPQMQQPQVPQQPPPSYPCPPAPQQTAPNQNQQNNTIQQLQTLFQNPQAQSMLTNLLSSNLSAVQRSARESLAEGDDDASEFLPMIASIASALVPTLVQAAPSIIQGVSSLFSKPSAPPPPPAPPPPQQPRYPPQVQAPQQQPQAPPPTRYVPYLRRTPPPRPIITQQQPPPQPTVNVQPQANNNSGTLSQLMSLLQSQQVMGALTDLLNSGVSRLTNLGPNETPVNEPAFLNAISEYARMAREELESMGNPDNLNYMRDNTGQWKYDPNISTYRAEALMETIHSQ